jgi:hypothetical protein
VTGGPLRETKFGVYHAAHLAMCSGASDPDFAQGPGLRFRSAVPAQSQARCPSRSKSIQQIYSHYAGRPKRGIVSRFATMETSSSEQHCD